MLEGKGKKNKEKTLVEIRDKNLMWNKKRWNEFQVFDVESKIFVKEGRTDCLISAML